MAAYGKKSSESFTVCLAFPEKSFCICCPSFPFLSLVLLYSIPQKIPLKLFTDCQSYLEETLIWGKTWKVSIFAFVCQKIICVFFVKIRFDLAFWETSTQIYRKIQCMATVFGKFPGLPYFPRKMVLYLLTYFFVFEPCTSIKFHRRFNSSF